MKRKYPFTKYFACSQSSSKYHNACTNHNKHITDILLILQNKAKTNYKGEWKQIAYRKAIAILRKYPKRIENAREIMHLRGIGKRIGDKIQEILDTGKCRKAEYTDERDNIIHIFSNIWGVGIKVAEKWYAQGYRSLADLKNNPPQDLNKNQKIGLALYNDLNMRIPRSEVLEIYNAIKRIAKQIMPSLKLVLCGSFRRGSQTCGDIDVLVCNRNQNQNPYHSFHTLIHKLAERQIITHKLTKPKSNRKFMGICRLNGDLPHRRIDFQLVAKTEYAFALLYFTGNDHLNRSMRVLAKKLGYSLSDKGLFIRHTNDLKGNPVECQTEKDIFQALGLDYIPPSERNH